MVEENQDKEADSLLSHSFIPGSGDCAPNGVVNKAKQAKFFECDRCGACCQYFTVPVTPEDQRREPLVKAAADRLMLSLPMATNSWLANLPPGLGFIGWSGELGQFNGHACLLLQDDGLCSVNETKPHCCSIFKPGEELCQWARGRAGLPPLTAWQTEVQDEIYSIAHWGQKPPDDGLGVADDVAALE